jgi:ribosomal protein S27AE
MPVYTLQTSELIRRSGEPTTRPPCPSCGRPMHLLRSEHGHGVLPVLRRYRCGECGVCVDEAED